MKKYVIPPKFMASIINMVQDGTISRQMGRDLMDAYHLYYSTQGSSNGRTADFESAY
jgi:hypothetical protein